MEVMRYVPLLVLLMTSTALADDPAPSTMQGKLTPPAPLSAFQFAVDVPPPPPVSLRLEAVRTINENWENSWRYPQPGPLFGVDSGTFFIGNGYYRPRTKRSAALHGGSIAATMAGQILLGTGSPLAGVAGLVAGATLDAAAADVDRDHESQRGR